jgi:CubicO group peptidase (beta-lactamase class C family)
LTFFQKSSILKVKVRRYIIVIPTSKENTVKKLLVSMLLAGAVVPAFAQHHYGHGYGHGYWHRGYGGGWNWVVPAIIGGAVVYGATRPDPVIVQQPVIVQPPVQVPQGQNCSPWTETQNSDGTITRTRTCAQ